VLGEIPFEADFQESVVVDLSSSTYTDQMITGFGGAFTESSSHLFKQLSQESQEEVIDLYFGNGENGISYNTGRVHINSCDFSLENWAFDNVAGDSELAYFDKDVKHDTEEMIPFIKRAMAKIKAGGEELRDDLQLVASSWSPPWWMKKSQKMDSSVRGELCVRDEYVASWAKYISMWISAYKRHGVPIWAMTIQNEPDNTPRWEACWFPMKDEAMFVRDHLGPILRSDHDGKIGIFFMDSYDRPKIGEWAAALYDNGGSAREYVSGIALHWYMGDHFDAIAKVHKEYPQALILQSEATWEFSKTGDFCQIEHGVWRFGEGYAHDIVGTLNAGGSGWIDWNLLLDTKGGPNHVGNMCDAPIMVDGPKYYVHPQFWYIGHFSKYMSRGSLRIPTTVSGSKTYTGRTRDYGTCTEEDGLQATSFLRPDGQVATVVLNCGDEAISFKIRHDDLALRASIPAHAIQTYVFKLPNGRKLATIDEMKKPASMMV
jgi:glucosylceramidase